jgi:hypothetical protein
MAAGTDQTAAIARSLTSLELYPASCLSDRGVVLCASGTQMFINAYVLLRVLRETLRCDLPIELWHFDACELSSVLRRLLEQLDVELVDADTPRLTHLAPIVDGWQLKPYAILHLWFREFLLLDTDQVSVHDLVELFGWRLYFDKGAFFWSDIIGLAAENPVWSLCGPQPSRCASIDSGQLVVNKEQHWAALQLTLHLNAQGETFYRRVYGDKDKFLIGGLLAGAPNAVVPHRPSHDPRRLRAYCTELTARNPRLRECLGDVAALILARATTAEPPVVRSAAEILRGHNTRAWHPC